MTERLKGCTVVFTNDVREDDAEFILNAIRMIKGVSIVEPSISENSDHITEMRMQKKFIAFLETLPERFRKEDK